MVQYFSDWDGLVLVGVRWRGGGGGAEVVGWVEMVFGGVRAGGTKYLDR
jgi:hypothetical protein